MSGSVSREANGAERGGPLWIAGSGRSGTTWVLDAIAASNGLSTVFEPFHPDVGGIASRFAHRWVDPADDSPELRAFVEDLSKNRFRSIWTDYRIETQRLRPAVSSLRSLRDGRMLLRRYQKLWRGVRRHRSEDSRGVIVKAIRANLLLDWLACHCDFRILLVVRHPCAVVESKIRLDREAEAVGLKYGRRDWDPGVVLDFLLTDEATRQRLIEPFTGAMDLRKLSVVQQHAVIWCVENAAYLNDRRRNDITVTFYEDLVARGESEWRHVSEKLRIDVDATHDNVHQPSQQASKDFIATQGRGATHARWTSRMSDDDKAAIGEVLQWFQVSIYDPLEPLPRGRIEGCADKDSAHA